MRDLFSLAGRVAVVTGATSGIGNMLAEGLTEAGATVYVVARDEQACARVASALPGARALPGDLGTKTGIDQLVHDFATHESTLDLLVNNAGTLRENDFAEFTEPDWDDVMDVNLKAPFFLTQGLLPALRAAASTGRHAAVVNIGSVGGLRVGPRATYSYAASKAGLHHLTRSLARRLAGENITVNAIAPGFFPSRLSPADAPAVLDAVTKTVPRGRPGDRFDITGATTFFASLAGAYVTGAVLPLDGGMSL